jgi:methionyl-tRNA synthetase
MIYISTTIPYVNAAPHIGFALELVQADVLARHYRARGHEVWFQTGSDENALKNVLAARAAGISTAELVARNAARFAALREPLQLSYDDFIRTSSDPRHAAGVSLLWRACEASGDLYQRSYQGLYCVGCERFCTPGELVGGRCPEHGTPAQPVSEVNWFFRLSRYQRQLTGLIESGAIRIQPAARRNEVLAFLAAGLDDISVSRPAQRARGWGIPVPGDDGQVIYVWFDALANYITAPGYGSGAGSYQRRWAGAQQRIHLVGKDVLRFHAVYWPAILLSAGEPVPTEIGVHDFLTVTGSKISKSAGTDPDADPFSLVSRYGGDAVRWWLLREVAPLGETDFSVQRLAARANADLAGGIGNLVSRVVSLVHRYRSGVLPGLRQPIDPEGRRLAEITAQIGVRVSGALAGCDFRTATEVTAEIVAEANRFLERTQPWHLARAAAGDGGRPAQRLDQVLAQLVTACRALARELEPFLPGLAGRIRAALGDGGSELPPPRPVYLRRPPAGVQDPQRNLSLSVGPSSTEV